MINLLSALVGVLQAIWKWLLAGLLIVFLVMQLGRYLSPTDQLRPADAIVAISGGDTLARASAAISLYEQGWAPKIVFSGAALDPDSPSNAEVMKQLAVQKGVPPSAVLLEEQALDTTQNARLSSIILDKLAATEVILVTSGYHQRRAALEFTHATGGRVAIINQPTLDRHWSRFWWLTAKGWWLALTEVVKIAAGWVLGRF